MNNGCNHQITLKDFPYPCCKAQKYCPPVFCPYNYMECPVYLKEYNTNTSTHYPTNEGNDIVRAYENKNHKK